MRRILIATLLSLCCVNAAHAEMTKSEVQAIVKEYLKEEPQVVIDALEAYRDQQEKLAQEKSRKAIQDNHAGLFNRPTVPAVGPQDADVVIAEFFDYHCGYCKRMIPVITKLLEEDKKVRVVFHELPILSADSKLAAKAALAVFQLKPNAYFSYHTKLMEAKGDYTKDMLVKMAKEHGVDEKKFTTALDKKELDNALKSSSELAKKLGITGTPAFIVGDEFAPGAVSLEKLKGMIAEQRKKAKK